VSKSFRVSGYDDVARKLIRWQQKYERNLLLMVGAFAGRAEAKMVRDRPWTDQTNAARSSLTGSYDKTAEGYIVALAIGVEYGRYLELARGGKYRVIRPTVDQMRNEFKRLPKDAAEVTRV
jgi:hypothetical protein